MKGCNEIVIYRKDENFPIARINVSYEYTEFQVTLNDPDGSREPANLSVSVVYSGSVTGD